MNLSRKRVALFAVLALCMNAPIPGYMTETAAARTITRTHLVEDIRTLAKTIETAHPDPYRHGGGRIAWHRRLHALIDALPETGLSETEFAARLQRFLAEIGDGHTFIDEDGLPGYGNQPSGLPVGFEVVDGQLYIARVRGPALAELIGGQLVALEGVPFSVLLEREMQRRGHDNAHHALSAIRGDGALHATESLNALLPEWDGGEVTIKLRMIDGGERVANLRMAPNSTSEQLKAPSAIDMPGRSLWFGYYFYGQEHDAAYLWIDNMTTYREMYEQLRATRASGWDWQGLARRVFERVHERAAPQDLDAVIDGIPSAAETFDALLRGMRERHTETLIIDLSHNGGGNDLMVHMLLCGLAGFDATVTAALQTATVGKRSTLLDQGTDDYDFSLDTSQGNVARLRAEAEDRISAVLAQSPTFEKLADTETCKPIYRPRRILVLVGNATQSSGFDLAVRLQRLGAETVGVTPSQAGNSFGNIRRFTLQHSGLAAWVSTKYFEQYRGEAPGGFAVTPDHPLNWEKLAAYGFDPHAAVRYALEINQGR